MSTTRNELDTFYVADCTIADLLYLITPLGLNVIIINNNIQYNTTEAVCFASLHTLH